MDSNSNFSLESLHLPPGYRFDPTDEEVVNYFLLGRVLGRSLTANMIQDLAIFRYNPEQLPLVFSDMSAGWGYFFVYRKLGDEEGVGDCVRTTPGGYWKANGTGSCVMDRENKETIGFMRKMVFYRGKAPDGEKTDWLLREYRLNPALSLLKNPHNTEKIAGSIKPKSRAAATAVKFVQAPSNRNLHVT